MKIMFNPIIKNISFKAPLKNIYVIGYDASLIKFDTLKDATEYLHNLYKTNSDLRMLYKIVDGEVIEMHKGDGSYYVDYDKVNMLADKLSKLRKKKPNEVLSQKTQASPSVKRKSEGVKLNQEIKNTPVNSVAIDMQLGYETRLRIAKENFDWKMEGVHLDSSSDDKFKNKYSNSKKTDSSVKTPQTPPERIIIAKEDNAKTEKRAKSIATSAEKVITAKENNTKTAKRAKTKKNSADKVNLSEADKKTSEKTQKSSKPQVKKTVSEKAPNNTIVKRESPKTQNMQVTVPSSITDKRTGHEIYAVNRYGKVILYSGITNAAKKLKITPADIVNCMIGKKSTAAGFKFALASSVEEIADNGKVSLNQEKIDEIVKSFPKKIEQPKHKLPFYIYQITKNGDIKRFFSIAQAQKMTRIPYDKIEDCLDNTDKVINGSVFLTSAQVMKLDENADYVVDEDKIASIIKEKLE